MKVFFWSIFLSLGLFNNILIAQNIADSLNIANNAKEEYNSKNPFSQYPGGEEGFQKYLSTIEYPREAISNDEEGTVYVKFVVGLDGNVTSCEIEKSSGSIILDNAALNHLKKQDKWIPGYMPMKVVPTVPIRFKLSDVSVGLINGVKKYNEGVKAFKENDYIEAINKFEQAYKINKEDYHALYNIAASKYKINDTDAACKIWVYLKSNELFFMKSEINNFCRESKYIDVLSSKHIDYLTEENRFLDSLPKYPGGTEKLKAYLSDALFPEEAKKKNYEGTVVVKAYIDSTGSITNSEILKSAGQELLDKAAVNHVSKMPKWIPAIKNGNATSTSVAIKVKYFLFNDKFWE
jgi:TonB family protein